MLHSSMLSYAYLYHINDEFIVSDVYRMLHVQGLHEFSHSPAKTSLSTVDHHGVGVYWRSALPTWSSVAKPITAQTAAAVSASASSSATPLQTYVSPAVNTEATKAFASLLDRNLAVDRRQSGIFGYFGL